MKLSIFVVAILLFSLVFTNITIGLNSENKNYCSSCSSGNKKHSTGEINDLLHTPPGITVAGNAPDSWDWRNVDGKDYTTSVKEQGGCGSCYAFGNIAALESIVKIKLDRSDLNVDLSEQFIVTCGTEWCEDDGIKGCDGAKIIPSYEFIEDYGAIPECFFRYISAGSGPYIGSCSDKYSDWEDFTVKIKNWGFVGSNRDNIKNALVEYGPLPASMVVYDDFNSNYNGGVYEHLGDESEENTNHRVTIVGYDDSQNCWICKNSWGTDWGENGWFRIKYGDCRIEDFVVYFELEDFDLIDFDLDFTIHRIKQVDDIDPDWALHGEADWSYRISVYNDLILEHKSKNYCDEDDDHIEDVTHTFHLYSLTTTPTILVKVWDRDDVLEDHDLADVSSKSGGGEDNDIDDKRGAMLHFKYDTINNEIIEIDEVKESDDGIYYTSEGNGNNHAKIWFKVNDNYEPAPLLSCNGDFDWSDVKPGEALSGSFTVENIGAEGSTLDWAVKSNPNWGSDWSFNPSEGSDLSPDGEVTVQVSFTAPDSYGGDYSGEIEVENSDDISNTDTVSCTLDMVDNSPPRIESKGCGNGEGVGSFEYWATAFDSDGDEIDEFEFKVDGKSYYDRNPDGSIGEIEVSGCGLQAPSAQVRAKDEYGKWGSWSQPFSISKYKNNFFIDGLFRIFIEELFHYFLLII